MALVLGGWIRKYLETWIENFRDDQLPTDFFTKGFTTGELRMHNVGKQQERSVLRVVAPYRQAQRFLSVALSSSLWLSLSSTLLLSLCCSRARARGDARSSPPSPNLLAQSLSRRDCRRRSISRRRSRSRESSPALSSSGYLKLQRDNSSTVHSPRVLTEPMSSSFVALGAFFHQLGSI